MIGDGMTRPVDRVKAPVCHSDLPLHAPGAKGANNPAVCTHATKLCQDALLEHINSRQMFHKSAKGVFTGEPLFGVLTEIVELSQAGQPPNEEQKKEFLSLCRRAEKLLKKKQVNTAGFMPTCEYAVNNDTIVWLLLYMGFNLPESSLT